MQIEILDIGKNQLLTFLKIAEKHQTQIAVIAHVEEIDFKFMDPSQTSVGHLKFSNNTHCKITNLEQDLDGKKFELNIKDMIRVLSHLKNQIASMNTEDDGINFVIKRKDTEEIDKKIQIPTFVAEQKVDFNEIKYQKAVANISLPLADFTDAVKEAVDYSTEVMYFIIERQEKGTINFILNSIDKDNLRKKITIIKKQDTDFTLVKDNDPVDMKVAYNITLLSSLVMQAPEYSNIILTFAQDSPVTMIYNNEADFNLKCMLANKNPDME